MVGKTRIFVGARNVSKKKNNSKLFILANDAPSILQINIYFQC